MAKDQPARVVDREARDQGLEAFGQPLRRRVRKASAASQTHASLALAEECVRIMLRKALDAEVADYLRLPVEPRASGHAVIVRNGTARARTLTVGSVRIQIEAPRVNDRRSGSRFVSRILPPYLRRTPKLDELLRVVQRSGLSRDDLSAALSTFLGDVQLSIPVTSSLSAEWQAAYGALQHALARGAHPHPSAAGAASRIF